MIAISPAKDGTDLRRLLADIMRPRPRVAPSAWAEDNRHLKEGTTPAPGRWRNDYLPWLKPILDAYHEETWCEGIVVKKPAQGAGTEILVTLIGYFFATAPGPTLFVTTTDLLAREFALDRFDHMIDSTPELRRVFLQGKANRETILTKPAIGGKLNIVGAGSPNKLISRPCRYVFLDEEDRLPNFPNLGAAREIAEKRLAEFGTRVRVGIFSIAHPTVPGVGVAHTYEKQSDRREWTVKCPHCRKSYIPKWEDVYIEDNDDPDGAVYRCPGCGEEISDAQRWSATRRGRFVAQRKDDEPPPRYVGFHFSRLCHPRVPLANLARKFVACKNEAEFRVFFNMDLGLEYQEASIVITEEAIKAKVDERGVLRRTPAETAFITVGADVQKGRDDVVIYYVVVGWTRDGNAHVLAFGKLLGFAAFDALIRRFEAEQADRKEPRRIRAGAVDYGWKTRLVYQFCRLDHGGVKIVPIKHSPYVTRDDPTLKKKNRDPLHPELGTLIRLDLCRDYWMDRVLGRYQADADPTIGGSVVLPPETSNEFIAHFKANHQEEQLDRHNDIVRTWVRDQYARDDFAQAFLAAEVAAVALGLDRLFLEGRKPKKPPVAHEQRPESRGRISRVTRRKKARGYVRGRRGRG